MINLLQRIRNFLCSIGIHSYQETCATGLVSTYTLHHVDIVKQYKCKHCGLRKIKGYSVNEKLVKVENASKCNEQTDIYRRIQTNGRFLK